MSAKRRTTRRCDPDGAPSEAAEFSAKPAPGRALGILHGGEDLWREILCRYPSAGDAWFGLDVDGKVVEEKVLAADEASAIPRVFASSPIGNGLKSAEGKFYRFAEYPEASEFIKHIKAARASAVKAANCAGEDAPEDPGPAIDPLGGEVIFESLFPVGPPAPEAMKKKEVKPGGQEPPKAAAAVAEEDADGDGGVTPGPEKGPGADGFWRVVEEVEGTEAGDVAPTLKSSRVPGVRGSSSLASGASFVVWKDVWNNREQFVEKVSDPLGRSGQDARVAPMVVSSKGRKRTLQSYLSEISPEDLAGFPVVGPRTAIWWPDFVRRQHALSGHHLFCHTMARLQSEQSGMQEHEHLMKLVESGSTYDQEDLSNLAIGEVSFGRARAIEWAYHDKWRDTEAAAPRERLSPEELSAFSGLDRTGDPLTEAPALLDYVKGVVDQDAAVMKNIREAKEEREALKKGA